MRLRDSPDYASSLAFGISDGSNIWKAFKRICEDAGLEGLRLHDLRHTFATRLAQAGLPLNDLARLLGHSNVTTTFRYTNSTPQTLRRATEILDGLNGIVSLNQYDQESGDGGFIN